MCGIVGILGKSPAAPRLLTALKRLEYRGYDSAGIATLEKDGIECLRAEGKLRNLEEKLGVKSLGGYSGIGHTRWATHGAPTEKNAHPHATKRVALVHNGIIENYSELKVELGAAGVRFKTETDTEVLLHLIDQSLRQGNAPVAAVRSSLRRARGAFAIAAIFREHDDLMIVARKGSPLAIGYGKGEVFVGSDAIALAPFTDQVTYLMDGDYAVITRASVSIFDEGDKAVSRPTRHVSADMTIDKGGYKHFMQKEIHEQPEVVGHTLAHYLDFSSGDSKLVKDLKIDFSHIQHLTMTACGTAFYACLVAKYWFERYARLPVDVDIASEFRYREVPLKRRDLFLAVSQSGETADTLESIRYAKKMGQRVAAIVNVRESTIAREADIVLPTLAGPEIGVASTKASTCQLAALAALVIVAGKQRGTLNKRDELKLVLALSEVPRLMTQALTREPEIKELAQTLAKSKHALFIGRGTSLPLAFEGALKLKEISYIHAEGYGAGELKHGPVALIDEHMPVIVIAPQDGVFFEKTMSNVHEVAARKGRIILLTDLRGERSAGLKDTTTIVLPEAHPLAAPFVYSVALQLLAYHAADYLGTDVDQPRNLAKSVTVE